MQGVVSYIVENLENSETAAINEEFRVVVRQDDPSFQTFCLSYGTNQVIGKALEEELDIAYSMFYKYLGIDIPQTEDEEKQQAYWEDADQQFEKIKPQVEQIMPIAIASQVLDVQTEINEIMTGKSDKKVTSYQANRVQDKFDNIAEYLTPEQQAAGYYNISLLHRILLGEKDFYDPEENNSEKICLQKVLDYSSDFKRIEYCVNRLSADSANHSRIRAAYRRALTAADTPYSLYKINMALAQSYMDDYKPVIGYKTTKSEKLERAEFYFTDALAYAPEADRLSVLKNIAKVQKQQGKIEDWTYTRTVLAMSILQGEERSYNLIEVGLGNPRLRREYLERAAIETKRSKLIDVDKKAQIFDKIEQYLLPMYKNDETKKAWFESLRPKMKKMERPDNPLDLFKLRQQKGGKADS